jgi:phytoene/squalene synthetase
MDTRSPQPREPFFAWPGMASFKLTIPLSYLFFKIFSSVYGGASLIAKLRRPHADFFFPWEMRLPFLPSWALIYLTVPLLLLATPFILRTWRSFTPFMLTLTIETLIAGVFFLGMPLAQAYPARVADGFFGSVFHLADRLNLDYNKFPSLHIAFAVTAAIVFARRCGWFGRGVLTVWIAAVFASTLLIHEHQLLDLAGGLALGLAGSFAILRRVSQEPLLETLRIEALCLSEFWGLVRRHPRYLRVFFALFRASLPGWRQRRPLRVAYCLAQHVDDVLDGDRPATPADVEPEAYVRALLVVLDGGPLSRPAEEAGTAELLAAYLATALEPATTGMKDELSELFAVLIEDRRRMDERRTMTSPALAEHHRRTFHLALDLAFQLSGSRLRAVDTPELIEALAWSSPVRDLDEDLEKGLINVPAEVIAEAGWTGREENLEPILDTPAVVDWLRREHRRGAASILALGERLPSIDDRRGRKILAAFRRVLAAYERKYRRRHPDLTEPPAGLAPAPPLLTRRPRPAGRRG